MDFDALELLLQASLPVQIILAILVIASITSWVLIFEKYFTLSRSTDISHDLEDRFWEGEKIDNLYLSLNKGYQFFHLPRIYLLSHEKYLLILRV
tara:strand:- start:167 stop:451 length:285 start_codon:yes stop_codon:yes gene_type:complete